MTFEEKYGYKQYSHDDPEMKYFIDAMDYLEIPRWNQSKTLRGTVKVLKKFDLLDGQIWDSKKYSELVKYPTAGRAWLTIVIIAQMVKRGEINI